MNWSEILGSLNCGVGLAVIVDAKSKTKALQVIKKSGHRAWVWGQIEKSKGPAGPTWALDLQAMGDMNQ